jgi:hypothetical protein
MGIIENLVKRLDVDENKFAKMLAEELIEKYNLKIRSKAVRFKGD